MQRFAGFKTSAKTAALLALCFGVCHRVQADPVTDTSLGVTYTATSTFVAGPGNVYDVFLKIDPTAFNQGAGYLTAFALMFKTGSDVSTNASLLSASGGVGAWSAEMPGGLNSGGCDMSNPSSGFVCFQNLGAAGTKVPGGPYNFEIAVTMPGTDVLTAASDIKAAYNTHQDNSGKNLGLTSMGITIQDGDADAPEPASAGLLLMGAGAALGFIRKRRKL